MKHLAPLFAFLAVTACGNQGVTDSERDERQSLAFDVSGRYVEDAAKGTPSGLTIANEQGFHDIVATFELRGGLGATDRERLTEDVRRDDPKLADADVTGVVGRVEAALASVTLSQGPTFTERGGENVALDHTGDTGEIVVRKTVDAVAQTKDGTYTLTVTLYLTAHKDSSRLGFETTPNTDDEGKGPNGSKGLLFSLTRTAADGEGGEFTETVTNAHQLQLGELVKY